MTKVIPSCAWSCGLWLSSVMWWPLSLCLFEVTGCCEACATAKVILEEEITGHTALSDSNTPSTSYTSDAMQCNVTRQTHKEQGICCVIWRSIKCGKMYNYIIERELGCKPTTCPPQTQYTNHYTTGLLYKVPLNLKPSKTKTIPVLAGGGIWQRPRPWKVGER